MKICWKEYFSRKKKSLWVLFIYGCLSLSFILFIFCLFLFNLRESFCSGNYKNIYDSNRKVSVNCARSQLYCRVHNCRAQIMWLVKMEVATRRVNQVILLKAALFGDLIRLRDFSRVTREHRPKTVSFDKKKEFEEWLKLNYETFRRKNVEECAWHNFHPSLLMPFLNHSVCNNAETLLLFVSLFVPSEHSEGDI